MPKPLRKENRLSAVSVAFVENSGFLKKFITRFFTSQQEIEDVVQLSGRRCRTYVWCQPVVLAQSLRWTISP